MNFKMSMLKKNGQHFTSMFSRAAAACDKCTPYTRQEKRERERDVYSSCLDGMIYGDACLFFFSAPFFLVFRDEAESGTSSANVECRV